MKISRSRQSGAVLLAAALGIPLIITLFLGTFDVVSLLATRYIAANASSRISTLYKIDPFSVDLQKFTERIGMGWVKFGDRDDTCIVVTSHPTRLDASENVQNHDCSTKSMISIRTDQPFFAISTHYRNASIFSKLLSSEASAIQINDVIHVNVTKCISGQAMVSDGRGGVRCTNDYQDLWREVERLNSVLDGVQKELDDVEKKVADDYQDLLSRINKLRNELDSLADIFNQFRNQTNNSLRNIENQINNIRSRIANIRNLLNSNNQGLGSNAAQLSALFGSLQGVQNRINDVRNSYINSLVIPYYFNPHALSLFSIYVGWHGPMDTTGKGGYHSFGGMHHYNIAPHGAYKRCYLMAAANSQDGKKGDDHNSCSCDVYPNGGMWQLVIRWDGCKGYCRWACDVSL